MEVVVEFIIVLFIALLIASIFSYGFQNRGPWGAFWVFVLILFFAAWVGRLWITPAGPVIWGFAWLPVVFFVFIVALLIAAASPTEEVSESQVEATEAEREAGAALGAFFWILLIFLLLAILAGSFV